MIPTRPAAHHIVDKTVAVDRRALDRDKQRTCPRLPRIVGDVGYRCPSRRPKLGRLDFLGNDLNCKVFLVQNDLRSLVKRRIIRQRTIFSTNIPFRFSVLDSDRRRFGHMNIIKLILGAIGLIFVGMLLFWVLGFLSSIIWYLFWIGVLVRLPMAATGYLNGRKPGFRERHDPGSIDARDFDMSWDEYDKKYLHK